jgi:hypothetical protein
LGHFGYADNLFAQVTVVIEQAIAHGHSAEVYTCRVIAYTCPCGLPVGYKLAVRINVRFGFNKPKSHNKVYRRRRCK